MSIQIARLPKVIGITGRKRHGKDTVGQYLVSNYGYTRIAFADCIKEMVKISFGFTDEQLYGNKKEEMDEFWKISPREVLQYIGTELFRDGIAKLVPHVGKDFWLFIVKRKMELNPDTNFVITDMRFENEVDFVNSLGGTTIRVERPNYGLTDTSAHESETHIDALNVAWTITNNDTLYALYTNVDAIVVNMYKNP